MTEAEWLSSMSPRTVLEGVRRYGRYRTGSAVRKARMMTCEVLRVAVEPMKNQSLMQPIERTEEYIAGNARLADIEASLEKAECLEWSSTVPLIEALAVLTHADPFANTYELLKSASLFHGLSLNKPYEILDAKHNERILEIIRDIFGNPFRPVTFDPAWRTSTATAIARQMYDSRDFGAMPILADALQDAGCDNDDILNHCRDANGIHVRGCWVVDLVLGKS